MDAETRTVVRAGLDASAYTAGAAQVAAANERIATSGEAVVRTQEAAEGAARKKKTALDRLQESLDQTYRAQQQFQQAQTQINSAVERGSISAQRAAELQELARQKYLAGAAAADEAAAAQARLAAASERAADVQRRIAQITGLAGNDNSRNRAADIEAYGRSLDELRAKYVPLFAAQQRYQQQLDEIARAERIGAISAAEAAAARARLGQVSAAGAGATNAFAAANDNAGRGAGRMSQAMGAAGYQIQDFAVQVQMGQNAISAFGAQASQFLGIFGTGGAIAGAVLTVGLLAYQILGALDATKELDKAVRGSEDAYTRANAAAEAWQRGLQAEAEAIQRLTSYYANLDTARRAYEVRSLEASRRQLQDSALSTTEDAASGLRGFETGLRNAIALGEQRRARGLEAGEIPANLIRAREALASFNATRADDPSGALVRLAEALAAASREGGPYADAMTRIVQELDKAVPSADRLTRQLGLNAAQLAAARGESDPAAAGIAGVGSASGTAAAEIARMATQLRGLAAINVADPLAEIEREIGRTTAQLAALRRGGLGGLAGERDDQERARAGEEAFTRVLREQTKAYEDLGLQRQEAERRATDAASAARTRAEEATREAQRLRDAEREAIEAQRDAERAREQQRREAERQRQAEEREEDRARQAREREEERARDKRERDAERAREQQRREAERTTDDIVRYGADAFADMFDANGRGWRGMLDTFEATFRRTLARMAAEAIIRPIIQPIVAGIMGMPGGDGSMMGGLTSMLGLSGLGSGISGALGLGGMGAGLSGLLGTTVIGASGPIGPTIGGAAMGGGASLGQLIGGAGLGFGAGVLLNGIVGGNRTNGMIGSGGGAAAGAVIGSLLPGVGTVIGGLIGGAGGGLLGGMIGPRTGPGFYHLGVGAGADGMLSITDSGQKRAGQQLAALQQQTQQQIAALNQQMAALGLRASGRVDLGANVRGATQIGGLGDVTTQFRLTATDARIQGAIDRVGGGSFTGGLGAAQSADALIKQIDAFAQAARDAEDPLGAVRRQFDGVRGSAEKLGFGLDEVNRAQDRAIREATARLMAPVVGGLDGLADYARSLRTANDNGGNPMSRLAAAEAEFNRLSGLAAGGDATAIGRFQQSAEQFRALSRDVFGTGRGGVADAETRIAAALEQIGNVGADALTASVLQATQREQTDTLVAALARVQDEVRGLRREVQQQAANPLAARVA